jgi:thimet oligopeptidase
MREYPVNVAGGKMMLKMAAVAMIGAASVAAAGQSVVARPADPLRAWVGLKDAGSLSAWTEWHLAEEKRLVAELTAAQGARTVESTLQLYDQAQFHLTVAGEQTNLMFSTHADKAVRDRAQALLPEISAASVALSLNQEVYRALSAIDAKAADAATKHYLERTLLEYRLAGVDKDAATRDKVKQLADAMTKTATQFSRNIQDDVRKVVVTDKSELDGLPADYLKRHPAGADGTITLTTDSPDYTPVMTYARSARLRREMYLAYNERGYPQNQEILLHLLGLREEMASTLGFKTWADLATADQMMGSAAKMQTFLSQVDAASKADAAREFDAIQAFAAKQDAKALPLALSDSAYWTEQYRRSAYNFDSQSVRPYFAYAEVEAGILKTAAALFHLEFRRAEGASVWDASVHAYDVYDVGAGGAPSLAGRIYLDMHPRAGKDKWFSETGLIPGIHDPQGKSQQLPEAALICNFPGGESGGQGSDDPGLMQYSDVVTFFHEFGHMMHEVLGGRQRWAGESGITTEGDFVEAPSQMLEEFFRDPKLLQSFARNYQTGEVLPAETIARMNRASAFGRGAWVQAQVLYSTYAMQLHDRPASQVDLDGLLKADYAHFSHYQFVDGNRMYASFTHLTGYSSNYYTYVLDKVIAVDFFSQFDPKNLLAGPTALRYRKTVLEPGGSKPASELVKDFLGRPENMDALKKWMNEEFQTP